MNIFECVIMSARAVASNKMRSTLTVIGVVIGVAAVIALVSLGQGAQDSIMSSMASLGTNIVMVETRGYARFEEQDVEMLLNRVPTLANGTPIFANLVAIKAGTTSKAGIELFGVTADFTDIMTYDIAQGRFFNESEVESRHAVVVLGAQPYTDLFGDEGGVGESIKINGQVFDVIGVTAPKGSVMGQNHDNRVFIPHTTAQRFLGTRYTTVAIFTAQSSDVASTAGDHIARILDEKFRNTNRQLEAYGGGQVEPYRVYCQEEMQESFSQVTGTLTLLLAGIAAVSLLVSGIGIMNIMLVSVTERTREIGIRKSIGARKKHLLVQFLIEALILSTSGGVIGLLLGAQMAKLIGSMGNISVGISPAAAVLAFGFATVVGVFFGIYPAHKAASLDPIEALRYQ